MVDTRTDASPPSVTCPSCGASAVDVGECPYCGKFLPGYEKGVDPGQEVLITAPGQRVIVNFLKAQHERAKGYLGLGCAVALALGGGGPIVAWYVGSRFGHAIVPPLATFVVGVVLGVQAVRLAMMKIKAVSEMFIDFIYKFPPGTAA